MDEDVHLKLQGKWLAMELVVLQKSGIAAHIVHEEILSVLEATLRAIVVLKDEWRRRGPEILNNDPLVFDFLVIWLTLAYLYGNHLRNIGYFFTRLSHKTIRITLLFGILRNRSRVIKHQILRLSVGDLDLRYLNPAKPTLTIHILQFNFLFILYQNSIKEVRIIAIDHFFGLEVVKERVKLLHELVFEDAQGDWMRVEVLWLHEVAEER